MRKFLICLVLFLGVFAQSQAMTKTDVLNIFEGVLEGVAAEANMTKVMPCIKDVSSEITLFEEAIKDFIKRDASHVKDGLRKLGEAIEKLPNAMDDCGEAAGDAKRLISLIKAFKSPWSFVYHVAKDLLVNGVQIYHDIESAIHAYQSQEWESFGYNIGHALAEIFLGMEKAKEQKLWKSKEYEKFKGLTNEEFKGKFLGLDKLPITSVPKVDYTKLLEYVNVPESFDATQEWPECIHPIRNQLHCGSCWAFAGSEVLSDRFCIQSKGSVNAVLSPQYMVSCDTKNHGCHGGMLTTEWEFLENTGTITDACWPYESGSGVAPACSSFSTCKDGSTKQYFKAKKGSTKSFANTHSIQVEIMTNGPVETGMYVYKDFPTYKGGVYHRTSWSFLGGHAVKIVGWGVENGVEYWKIANSWGPDWGENGFFRIKMGECMVDSDAIAGTADV